MMQLFCAQTFQNLGSSARKGDISLRNQHRESHFEKDVTVATPMNSEREKIQMTSLRVRCIERWNKQISNRLDQWKGGKEGESANHDPRKAECPIPWRWRTRHREWREQPWAKEFGGCKAFVTENNGISFLGRRFGYQRRMRWKLGIRLPTAGGSVFELHLRL